VTAQVIYIHSWLNCPDDRLRFHYELQEKINLGKAEFWQRIRDQRISGFQAYLCYDRWVHENRDRIKILEALD